MAALFDLSKNPVISQEMAVLQTKTCHVLLRLLKDNPGVVLGDDVGMGKTYVAFASAVCFLKKDPGKSIIIITPSWQMNDKWFKDIRDFISVNLNKSEIPLSIDDVAKITGDSGSFVEEIRKKASCAKVLLMPINALASMGWKREKSFYIACWFRHKRFHAESRKRLLKAVGGNENIFSPFEFKNMGITYDEIPEKWSQELDNLDISRLDSGTVSRIIEELKKLRYKAICYAFPNCSLLILDEAHTMKNDETVKRRALENCIQGRFERGLFVTATPFQLGEGELRSILEMFQKSAAPEDIKNKFRQKVDTLFREIDLYIRWIDRFEQYVKGSSPAEGAVLERLIRGENVEDTELNSDIRENHDTFIHAKQQKDMLENIMRTVVVRNIKQKDAYRHEIEGTLIDDAGDGIPLSEDNYLVFAMIEKVIHEILARGDRTFIASVKQSFTSSYSAAQASSINKRDLPSLEILHRMPLGKISHPKMTTVADEVVSAMKQGEKTLIFCNRIETIRELKGSITKGLDRAYKRDVEQLFPGENPEKEFESYRKRFTSPQDVSWFLLQENYIHSILVQLINICDCKKSLIPKAEELVNDVKRLYGRYNRSVKANYRYLKRIVEQLTFRCVTCRLPDWYQKAPMTLRQTVENILNQDYIEYGLNLQHDEDEHEIEEIEDAESRSISVAVIRNILRYKGLWVSYNSMLNELSPEERDELVSNMILWLRRDKRFFIELRKAEQRNPDKNRTWQIEQTFKHSSKRGDILVWDKEFGRFLKTYVETKGEGSKHEFIFGLRRNDLVASITGATNTDTREKIQAGFNTPFYPQVLIAMPVMQEGVDLQRECRRVINYDLEWNPASMEQRIGRVDRIGSLTSRLRDDDGSATLDIYYPFIKNTIDESIYKTVKDREKWFNLILGGTPQWDTFEVDPEVTNISSDIFKAVQIDLSVK